MQDLRRFWLALRVSGTQLIPVQHDPGGVMAEHLSLGSRRLNTCGKTWQRFQATHS